MPQAWWGEQRGLVLGWLEDPDPVAGLWFWDEGTGWRETPYARLARVVQAAGTQLLDAGVNVGDLVCLALPNSEEFAAAFYGAGLVGGVPCPVAGPGPLSARDTYLAHVGYILSAARPGVIVTTDCWRQTLSDAVSLCGAASRVVVLDLAAPAGDCSPRAAPDLSLVQFTSGSTRSPRGARVSWDNLAANIEMIRSWTAMTPERSLATWLPMFHDMGLVGAFLTPA